MSEIVIITGSWNAGKTSKLLKIYNSLEAGSCDGFASTKDFNDQGEFVGYSLMRLSTRDTFQLAVLKENYIGDLEGVLEFDRFIFFEEAFSSTSRIFERMIRDPQIKTICIDEIGPLELMGKGFAKILRLAIKSSKRVIIVANENNLERIKLEFNIQ